MGDEVGHDGGLAAHQLRFPVDNFSSNGPVSALLPPDFLPATGAATDADTAGGIRFPAEVMKGNESLIVKRKRGRPPKIGGQAKAVVAPAAKRSKKEEEDVCFICFDGGKLVLCDRRDCPKAYHPACVKRDESFFKRRVRWNCGWHLCNICQRNAVFMCYTCPYSLCKTCVKQADISCVRGSKGFCKTCMTTISLIENIKQGIEEVGPVDFDDTTSWEYLFKVYWVYLKDKESLTLDELTQATNPWRGLPLNHLYNYSSQGSQNNCTNRTVELRSTVGPLGIQNNQVDANVLKGRKARKQPILHNYSQERAVADKLQDGAAEWASQELLEFVSHVKSGDTSKLTHFDVQALLLEYIRKNKLRDPRRKCQIICDKRLEILFGKARVGHFEMLKLLEYHFKDGSCASSVVHAAAIDSSDNKLEECSEEVHIIVREGKRQTRQKVDEREIQINLDNFAAIDVHNMSLIYLKRSSMENLMEDAANFHDKVVGSIVRIRISGNDLNQELYRLVRVVGTGLAAESYKIGDKTAHIILKILNLDKIEDVRIDAISNQDFSEDECRRLRQSIKCGLVERLTVGEVHDKAVALQEVRIKDALEIEMLKLNHLRDRASEMGHRKELRECVKKLGLLKSPEECHRRMRKIPEVHADPRMDPVYQSDGDSEQSDTKQDAKTMPVHSNSISRSSESIAPGRGDMPCSTRAKLLRSSSFGMECKRNAYVRPKICREEDVAPIESSRSSLELETDAARILEELRNQVDPCRITTKKNAITLANHPWYAFDASVTSFSRLAPSPENCEHQKIWYYRDPSGKVQGPFCMMQLRKWNSSGYFPVDLRVWRIVESQDKSMLLVDALSNQRGKEHEFQSDCLDSHEMASLSEHGVRLSLNINAAGTADKSNGDCDTDLTDAAKCSDDKKQPNTGSGVKGVGLGSCSQLSPEEKWESVPEVSNSSPASRDTDFPTINQNHKPECSDLPSPMPKEDGEGATCLTVEPALQLCGPNVSSQKSSSSPKMSPGGLDPVQLSSTVNPEMDHANFKEQAEENKMDCEVEVHSQQVIPTVVQKNPSRESAQINVFELPSKIPDLNNAVTKSQLTEAKEPSTSYLPRKELCATWNVLSTGTEYSVPVSSANQSSEGGRELATEHCVTSNATCHDMGINWSTVTSLVSETVQWAGMKFSDHPTTTSGSCDFTRTLSSHPDCNTSSWTDGPIELSTLGDESVSDLLTEVEALESLNGMASPNARMDFGDDSIDSPSNDCFSRFVGLRPPLEPGKHDAWCTNCDIQFHSQPRITEPAAEQDLLSLTSMSLPPPLTTVNLQSSHHPLGVDSHTSVSLSSPAITPGIESEVKLHSVSNHEFVSYDQNLEPQPPATSRSHDELASGDGGMMLAYVNVLRPPPCSKPEPPSSPVEEGEMELATNDFSVKPPPPHPKTVLLSSNPSPDARKGAKPSGHGSLHQGRCHGTGGGRHSSGHKDRSYHHIHSVDLGFVKGPTRPGWHRPASFNCGEGASRPLPLHRGQRVCKFYESGYCKKGASCNYLHP